MALFKLKTPWENPDLTDSLGKVQIFVLLVSGVIWAFLAVNNTDTPDIFKISLIYSILLILGLLGIALDRGSKSALGIDSVLWDGTKLRQQLVFAVVFSLLWYIFFISRSLFLAVPMAINSPTFAVSGTTKFFLVTTLAPIAENIFFFGVVNLTMILFIRQVLEDPSKIKAIVLAALVFFSQALFTNLPYSNIILTAAALIIAGVKLTEQKKLFPMASVLASALIIGGAVFPMYHSKAYELKESNFVAAIFFGIFMCIIAVLIGMLVVDIVHITNNALALGG